MTVHTNVVVVTIRRISVADLIGGGGNTVVCPRAADNLTPPLHLAIKHLRHKRQYTLGLNDVHSNNELIKQINVSKMLLIRIQNDTCRDMIILQIYIDL